MSIEPEEMFLGLSRFLQDILIVGILYKLNFTAHRRSDLKALILTNYMRFRRGAL